MAAVPALYGSPNLGGVKWVPLPYQCSSPKRTGFFVEWVSHEHVSDTPLLL